MGERQEGGASWGDEDARPPCWLAVGEGAVRALEKRRAQAGEALASDAGRTPIVRVDDVHDALATVRQQLVSVCVVSSRVLEARPRDALQRLQEGLGSAPLIMVDPGGERKHARKAAEDLGVAVLLGEAPEEVLPKTRLPASAPPPPAALPDTSARAAMPPPLPRADADAPAAKAIDPEHFGAGCLPRIGNLSSLLSYTLRTLTEASNATRISVMLHEYERGTLRLKTGRGLNKQLMGTVRCTVGAGIAGRVAALGRPVTGHGSIGGPRSYDSSAFVVLPLGRSKRCEGVVCLTGLPDDTLPTPETLRVWARLCRHAGEALHNARQLSRARTLSTRDRLTRLPNRRAFENALKRELERAKRLGSGLVVGLMDIDHFKTFNDRFGHQVGDMVLFEVADRLKAAFRDSDLVARWGGEEFAVLLPTATPKEAEEAAGALERARLGVGGRPFALGRGLPPSAVTISGGMASFPAAGDDADALVAAADKALYEAKEAGRNRIVRA